MMMPCPLKNVSTSDQLVKRKRDENSFGEPDPKMICPFKPYFSEIESDENKSTDLAELFNLDAFYARAALIPLKAM